MPQTKWEQYRKDILGTPKFLKRGIKILVEPTEPKECTVEGRYGERGMYIVETKEHGLVYISPMQLVKIVDAFAGKYESAVTVEL